MKLVLYHVQGANCDNFSFVIEFYSINLTHRTIKIGGYALKDYLSSQYVCFVEIWGFERI